jgi:large subunit ribosomal protein L15
VKTYFEGGQTPLSRRVPKKGFRNRFGTRYQIVNVGDVERIDAQGKDIDAQVLRASGLIHSADRPVKILGGGEVSKPVSVKVAAYSKSAREKLKMPKAKAR